MCGTPFYALEIAVNEKGPGPKGLPGGKEETDRLLLFTMFGAGISPIRCFPIVSRIEVPIRVPCATRLMIRFQSRTSFTLPQMQSPHKMKDKHSPYKITLYKTVFQ